VELFALHKKSVSSVSVLAQRLRMLICQVADYLHEARNFLEFRTSKIAHACICTAFSIGIFSWWLFTVAKHPKKSYIGVNIHGRQNRSSRPGDCQTNVCSTVPERWQKKNLWSAQEWPRQQVSSVSGHSTYDPTVFHNLEVPQHTVQGLHHCLT